jgi:hypothetical protein
MRPVVRYKSGYAAERHIVRYNSQRSPVTAGETRRIRTRDMARVVSTSREIARAPQFKPEVRTVAPAMNMKKNPSRGNAQVAVAYKGRGESRATSATREKGAHKKVRDAE